MFQLGLGWLRGADALAAAVRRVVVYALTPRGTPRCWFVTAGLASKITLGAPHAAPWMLA